MIASIVSAAVVAQLTASAPTAIPEAPQVDLSEAVAVRNPWLAAGATLATPLILVPATGILATELRNQHVPWWTAPIGFGAGHFYAGDPWRGALVSLGGVAVINGAADLAKDSHRWGRPPGDIMPVIISMDRVNTWMFVAGSIYGLWAAWDAYMIVERNNQAPRGPLKHEGTER